MGLQNEDGFVSIGFAAMALVRSWKQYCVLERAGLCSGTLCVLCHGDPLRRSESAKMTHSAIILTPRVAVVDPVSLRAAVAEADAAAGAESDDKEYGYAKEDTAQPTGATQAKATAKAKTQPQSDGRTDQALAPTHIRERRAMPEVLRAVFSGGNQHAYAQRSMHAGSGRPRARPPSKGSTRLQTACRCIPRTTG